MKRVLVIDDEEVLRLFVDASLRRAGYEVLVAESGEKGLELARSELPDLVLSDVNMSGLDGFDLLKTLRSQPATSAIPVILMTGEPNKEDLRLGMEQGADDYLPKPFDMTSLLTVVKVRLERQESIVARAKSNEARLLEILSATQDLVAITEAGTGRLLYLNRAGRKMLGVGAEEDVGRLRLGDFHAQGKFSESHTEQRTRAEGLGIWVGESAYQSRDGRHIPVSQQILVHRSAAKETAYLSIVARDITERLAAEQALRESENRFRNLIESQGEGFVTADSQQRFSFANPAAEHILGVRRGSLVGRMLRDFMSEEAVALVARQAEPHPMGRQSGHEVEITAADGIRRQILITATPLIDHEGKATGTNAVFRDITARKQAEEALQQSQRLRQAILNNIPDPAWLKDAQGRYLVGNEPLARLYGRPLDDIVGKTVFDVQPERAAELAGEEAQVVASSKPIRSEHGLTDRTGCTRWFDTIQSPVLNDRGEVIGTVGIARDITERKEAEHQRQAMEVQLRQAQKLEAIGQLAAGIAHEINTPTQYVGDNARFLQDSFNDIEAVLRSRDDLLRAAKTNSLTPEIIARADQVSSAADLEYLHEQIPAAIGETLEGIERITKIVRAMKEFSHPGREERSSADLNRAIESTVTVARNEWKYVADVKLDLDPKLPAVPCFLGEFNQAILNLVVNASHAISDVVKQTPNGRGAITISTRREGQFVEIRVSDTGTGIPESARPKIFEPFFTTKAVGMGTGQGLSIVYGSIVKKHGGTIRFETEVGRGTTFIIRLPLAPRATDPASPARRADALPERPAHTANA